MGTHRVKIDIPEDSYSLLRGVVESDDSASESDAITTVIPQRAKPFVPLKSGAFEDWMREEILAADDECDLHPEQCLTSEQFRAHLLRARQVNEST